MKQSNKGFDYSYNAQAVVDSAEQIIVAAEVTNQANDKQQAVPMAKAALDNLEAAGIELPKSADGSRAAIPNTADAGYFSEKVVGVLEAMGIDPYIAIGREKDNKLPVAAEAAAPSAKEDAERKETPRRRCGPSCKRQLARRSTRCASTSSSLSLARPSRGGGFAGFCCGVWRK